MKSLPIPTLLAGGSNVITFCLSTQFYDVAAGTSIRPMGWFAWIFALSVVSFCALPMLMMKAQRTQLRFWEWLTILLAITPIPLGFGMLHHAAHVQGFTISE
jgi:hypothetical protein